MKQLIENWNKFVNEGLSIADELGISAKEEAEIAEKGLEPFMGPDGGIRVRRIGDDDDEGVPYKLRGSVYSHDSGMERDYERIPE